MKLLLDALDRLGLADELAQALAASQSCLLIGPSGSGKTELARYVALPELRAAGDICWIVGDKDQSGTSYLAAHRALTSKRPRRAAREADRELPTAALRGIPAVGGPISALAKALIARMEVSGPDFLPSEMQDILAGFQRVCLSKNVLFVVDNLHWLDPGTAELLLRMTSPEVRASYPFAARTCFLLVETSDQEHIAASATQVAALKRQAAKTFAVPFPTRTQFASVLKIFGLVPDLHSGAYTRLYDLTRGHLRLAHEIVRLLNGGELDAQLAAASDLTPAHIAEQLLSLRLDALTAGKSDIERLLGIASCIGQAFSLDELKCAFQDPSLFAAALDLARREEFLSGDGDILQFTHEVLLGAFRAILKADARPFHDQIAECIRILRPGDYRARLRHSTIAGNSSRSAALAFALFMQERRGEVHFYDPADRPADNVINDEHATLRAAISALSAMDNGQHANAIQLLIPYYTGENSLIQAEIAYLVALNYYKKRSRPDYENARAVLEPWKGRRDEGEVWQRLMLTLAVVNASLGDQRGSSETITRVRTHLERSTSYDPHARTKIQVLNRKADVFYPLEVAGVLIEKAVQYFAPPVVGGMPRNAFQYCAALINHAGNAYTRGEFALSAERADVAARLISGFSKQTRLPESYKAFNNYAIAAARGGQISPREGAEILAMMARATGDSDRFDYTLLSTNRAVLTILDDRLDEGHTLLARTYKRSKLDDVEAYYLVFVAFNLASSYYLMGNPTRAQQLLDEAERCLPDIPSEMRRSISLSLLCVRQAVLGGLPMDPITLDGYPRSIHGADGPHVSWRAFGYGFIMSDIQVWSES